MCRPLERRRALLAAWALAAAALLLPSPAWATPAWDIPALMALLAQHPAGRARFVETKQLALLDAPVRSSGTLSYEPPDRLEKHTLQPQAERLRVEGERVIVEQGERRRELRLQQYPEVRAMVEAIRGTLIGNQALLNAHYALRLTGAEQDWRLILTPRDERLARWVTQIVVNGQRGAVSSIETIQADGDRSLMTVQPESQPRD